MEYWILHINVTRNVLLILQIASGGSRTYIKFDTRLSGDKFTVISQDKASALLQGKDGLSSNEDLPNRAFGGLDDLRKWITSPDLEAAVRDYAHRVSTTKIRIVSVAEFGVK